MHAPLAGVAGRYRAVCDDLSLFAQGQFLCAAVLVVAAKALAVDYIFQSATIWATVHRLPSATAYDLILLGLGGVLVLVFGRLPTPTRWLRPIAAAFVYGVFAVWVLLCFVNTAFFMTVGTSLTYDLLVLTPALGGYMISSLTGATAGLMLSAACLVLLPLVAAPFFCAVGSRRVSRATMVTALAFLLGGTLSASYPARGEAKTLRNMTLAYTVLPASVQIRLDAAPPSRRESGLIDELLGTPSLDGQHAFADLPRRRHNVLVVVWESVGQRYLRDYDSLGIASTPNLRALAARGAVRFTHAYAQCPLTVQSVWALTTGMSPPAKPQTFLDVSRPLPPHGPMLPAVLRENGYRTAEFIGSYTRSWGDNRILAAAGLDTFEDIETLPNRDRFRREHWTIDGRALNERLWQWLDEDAGHRPFFGVVWNVETHYPYEWPTMTASERQETDKSARYRRVIERADELLGEIVAGLSARGCLDDTLVIVLGDHGEGMGRSPHPDQLIHGTKVYEDSVHVPLMFFHPSLSADRVADTRALLSDIYPTILDLLGIAAQPQIEGISLAAPVPPRPLLLRSMGWWPAAVLAGPYKLIRPDPEQAGVLYQIDQDRLEGVDVASDHPEIARALDRYLVYQTAQRRRYDVSMDADRHGFLPWVPSPFPPARPKTIAFP